jgi:hypothetical protein
MNTIAEIDQNYANECAQIGHKLFNKRLIEKEIEQHFSACDALGQRKRELHEKALEEKQAQKVADQLLVDGAKNA